MFSLKPLAIAVSGLFVLTPALAADVVQKVKPPVSQAYLDLATFSGGMPAMPGGGAAGMLGSFFNKGSAGGNTFGQTQGQSQGRWMDVVLLTRNNPNLKTATQSVPAGSRLAPTLNLLAPEPQKQQAPERDVPDDAPARFEMPKGKMYLYWGCGTEVRKGQPLVIDFAKMDVTQYNKFFQNRGATARVPTPVPGRPAWPNKTDARLLPEGASMAGEHAFAGDGVVDGFKFNIDAAHDLMPAVEASRSDDGKGVLFKWKAMPQATAWFVQAMGMRDTGHGGDNEMELVYWTSSELPDMGMGLVNYQPDSAIEKWRKEKVLLPGSATECAAPKEAVGATAMSRVIAYGDELNMAWPPRPKDPKITWEPQWDVNVRRKSVASLMPGMDAMAMSAAMTGHEADAAGPQPAQPAPAQAKTPTATDVITQGAVGLLRGMFKK
ncbi:hypothetical protein GCM10025794_02660 [Massilia kyonggiensis]|nr:hypothetical protein [Massilia kyonggiensis]